MADAGQALICDEMSQQIIQAAQRLATEQGAQAITVRKILKELDITNRVFYNRFRNISEVLDIVYANTIARVRKSMVTEIDPERDFFEQVIDIITSSLISSYDVKMNFNSYVFETDSVSESNYEWWTDGIKKLIRYAKAHDLIVDVDEDVMSYGLWCFCRGYNADAVSRGTPKDRAVAEFRYCFGFILEGMKKK